MPHIEVLIQSDQLVAYWSHFHIIWPHFLIVWSHLHNIWPHLHNIWPHLHNIWPHFNIIWPHFQNIWPHFHNIRSHFQIIWPHFHNIRPHFHNVWPHFHNIWSHFALFFDICATMVSSTFYSFNYDRKVRPQMRTLFNKLYQTIAFYHSTHMQVRSERCTHAQALGACFYNPLLPPNSLLLESLILKDTHQQVCLKQTVIVVRNTTDGLQNVSN